MVISNSLINQVNSKLCLFKPVVTPGKTANYIIVSTLRPRTKEHLAELIGPKISTAWG